MTIGIQLLRVSNLAAIGQPSQNGVAPQQSAILMEGQVGLITLNQTNFRLPPAAGQVMSNPGAKAKILSAAAITAGTWGTFTATSTLIIELGYLDNDGYFTVHLSSVV